MTKRLLILTATFALVIGALMAGTAGIASASVHRGPSMGHHLLAARGAHVRGSGCEETGCGGGGGCEEEGCGGGNGGGEGGDHGGGHCGESGCEGDGGGGGCDESGCGGGGGCDESGCGDSRARAA